MKELLPKLRPKITVEESGYSFSIDKTSETEDALLKLDEMMDLPERLARKKKNRFVIFFDEFQEISRLTKDHLSIERRLRATMQKQKNVSYVFAGSKQHLLEPMLLDETHPFYRMGQLKCLDLIPAKEYEPFIRMDCKAFCLMTLNELSSASLRNWSSGRVLLGCPLRVPYSLPAMLRESWQQGKAVLAKFPC